MPLDFNQNTLGGRQEPSEACGLICVRFISILYRNGITFPSIPADGSSRELKCPGRLLNALANAIVDGNQIPIETIRSNPDTLPMALVCFNNDLQLLSFCLVRGYVGTTLVKYLDAACRSKSLARFKQIFFTLGMFRRCVTIVYDRTSDTIGFMDPHTYGYCGAIMACARFADLEYFAAWLAREIFRESFDIPAKYQGFALSVLSFNGKLAALDRPLDYPVPRVSKSARTRIFPARTPEETFPAEALPNEYTEMRKRASLKFYEEQVSRLREADDVPNNSQEQDPFRSSV